MNAFYPSAAFGAWRLAAERLKLALVALKGIEPELFIIGTTVAAEEAAQSELARLEQEKEGLARQKAEYEKQVAQQQASGLSAVSPYVPDYQAWGPLDKLPTRLVATRTECFNSAW